MNDAAIDHAQADAPAASSAPGGEVRRGSTSALVCHRELQGDSGRDYPLGGAWPERPGNNTEHRHGALGLMTPHDIHYRLAEAKWQQRAVLLLAAYAAHPERFSRVVPTPPPLPTAAWINQPATEPAIATPEGAGS